MIRNYLKIALRSLSRRKTFAAINVVGLSIAMACAAFIYNWVADELSFDTFYPKGERIFRVVGKVELENDSWIQAITSVPLAPALQEYYPEVENAVRFDVNDAIVEYGDKKIVEDYIILTDPSFYEIFDYQLTEGNTDKSLVDPYSIVLTRSMAKKYFGEENPIGKSLRLYMYDPDGNGIDYQVTGVMQDAPQNSHFRFNFLVSFSTLISARPQAKDAWFNNSYYTYLLLENGADAKKLESKIPQFADHFMGKEMKEFSVHFEFILQPIAEIYHHSDTVYEFLTGNYDHVWIFASIGIFVLILAGINYVNLATAFSFERAKEVGVRKVLGAFKKQLMVQHFMETIILVLVSIVLAGLTIEVLKPFFYELTGKHYLSFSWWSLVQQLSSFSLLLILVAGVFPAKRLANLKPIHALKNQVDTSIGKFGFWKLLVTFQFSITLAILVGLFVVREQLSFVNSKDLGYDKDNLLILRVNGSQEVKDGFEQFRNELEQTHGIVNVARSNSMIVGGLGNSNGIIKDAEGNKKTEMLYRVSVDHDYIKTHGVSLVAGRDFSPEINSDSTEAFIINEQAVNAFGWDNPEKAIGQLMDFRGREGRIIGVVKNFHFNSLHHNIGSMCLYLSSGNFSRIAIKGTDDLELLENSERLWNKHFPNSIFDHTFQDQALYSNYQSEQNFGKIFNTFSIVSIVIACLGLFGLVGFTVSKKMKEIGIRKVLGASVSQILILISRDFIKLIGLAAMISFPMAWWVMELWLNDFPFRTGMKPWFFMAAGLSVLTLSVLVVFFRTVRASMANPVDTLKEE